MRGQPFSVDPAGGLNTRDEILSMEPHYTPNCLNVVGHEDGSIRKRRPCPTFASTFTGSGSGIVSLAAAGGILLATASDRIYSVNTAGVSTNITGAALIGYDDVWSIVTAPTSGGQGPYYMMCFDFLATGIPNLYWTGTGNVGTWTASAGTMPDGQFMISFKNRIFVAGDNVGTNGCGVAASKVGDPRNWDTTSSATDASWLTNFDPTDGDSIRGFSTVGNYLLVFKQFKTYIVYDLNTGANRVLTTNAGCMGSRAVTTTPYGVVFLAMDGHVYLTDGSSVEKISDVLDVNPDRFLSTAQPIAPQALGLSILSGGNYFSRVHTMLYFKDHLYLSTGQTFNPGWTLDYNFKTKSWWRHSYTFSQAAIVLGVPFAAYYDNNGAATTPARIDYLFKEGATLDGSVKDGTSTYLASIESIPLAPMWFRRHMVQDYATRRRYHALRAWVGGTVNLSTSTDFGATYTAKASYTNGFGNPMTPVEHTAYSFGVSNSLSIKWSSTDANNWAVFPWNIYTQPRTD